MNAGCVHVEKLEVNAVCLSINDCRRACKDGCILLEEKTEIYTEDFYMPFFCVYAFYNAYK